MGKRYGDDAGDGDGPRWLIWAVVGGGVLLLGCCVLPIGIVAVNHTWERAAEAEARPTPKARAASTGTARVDLLWASAQGVSGKEKSRNPTPLSRRPGLRPRDPRPRP